jgi:hypothetical protein
MSSDLFEINRSLRDVQSTLGKLSAKDQRGSAPQPIAMLMRALAVQIVAGKSGSTDYIEFAKRTFGIDLARMPQPLARGLIHGVGSILKAATAPAMTTTAGWAAELAQTANWPGPLPLLNPSSVYAALAARGLRARFDGASMIKLPARTATQNMGGAFVVEGGPIRIARGSLTATASLVPKKLAVISTFTEELALYSLPNIEAVIQASLADDTRAALDSALLDSHAARATRPAGILAGVTPITATAGGGQAALGEGLGRTGLGYHRADGPCVRDDARRPRARVGAVAGVVVGEHRRGLGRPCGQAGDRPRRQRLRLGRKRRAEIHNELRGAAARG